MRVVVQAGGATSSGPAAGSGFELILQGFNWESYRNNWYKVCVTMGNVTCAHQQTRLQGTQLCITQGVNCKKLLGSLSQLCVTTVPAACNLLSLLSHFAEPHHPLHGPLYLHANSS